ncbi:MAG: hypothetical protein ABI671_12070 [Burkholderiales bacterium]
MGIEDRDYWHKDRARRMGHLVGKPGAEQPVRHQELTRIARAASVKMRLDPRPSRWPAFAAGVAVGTFATIFVVGLLRL